MWRQFWAFVLFSFANEDEEEDFGQGGQGRDKVNSCDITILGDNSWVKLMS